MPPQSRSSTCATCQKRKVKCDRLRPACSQCVKYKWTCPGYANTQRSQSHGGKESSVTNERGRNSIVTIAQRPKAILSKKPVAFIKLSPPPPIAPAITISFPPSSESSRLASLLVHHLSPSATASPFKRLGPFIDFVPTRIGWNRALDDVVRLICSAGQVPGTSSPGNSSPEYLENHRCEYYKALKSLRESIENEKEVLSSEVLCATVLLSWYEAYANENDDRWLTHTGGCSQLIQLRGPSRHRQDFDRALLHGQQHLIVSEALIRQKSCFLDEPVWREVLDIPVPSSESYPETLSLIASSASLARLASFRNDVHQFKTIKHADDRQTSLRQLLIRADEQRAELKKGLSAGMTITEAGFGQNNTTLLDLYKFSRDVQEDQIMTTLKPEPNALHIEIAETFRHVFGSLEIANKLMPVETAQLLLVVRKLSHDMLKYYGHPNHTHLWTRLEETVNRIDKESTRFSYEGYQT